MAIKLSSLLNKDEDKKVYRLSDLIGKGSFVGKSTTEPEELEKLDRYVPDKEAIRGGSFDETQKEVDHFIPIALGGTNEPYNLQALKSKKTISQKVYDFLTGKERMPVNYKPENRQEGKMLVEWEAINKYKSGEISLAEARAAVINWDNNPEVFLHKEKKDISVGVGDVLKAVPDVIGKGVRKLSDLLKKEEEPVLRAEIGEGLDTPQEVLKRVVVKPSEVPKQTIFTGRLPDLIKEGFEREQQKSRILRWYGDNFSERATKISTQYMPEIITAQGRNKLIEQGKITPEEAEIFSAIPEYTPVVTGMKEVGIKEMVKILNNAGKYKSGSAMGEAIVKRFGIKGGIPELNRELHNLLNFSSTPIKPIKDFYLPAGKFKPPIDHVTKLWEYATGRTNALTVPGKENLWKFFDPKVSKVYTPPPPKATGIIKKPTPKPVIPEVKPSVPTTTPTPVPKDLQPLVQEARKYDSAEEFEYAMSENRPFMRPEPSDKIKLKAQQIIRATSDRPRMSPKDFGGEENIEVFRTGDNPIKLGDYVYATREEAQHALKAGQGKKIYSKTIKSDDLIKAGLPEGEYFYSPKGLGITGLTDIWNKANKPSISTIKGVFGEKPAPFIQLRETTLLKDKIKNIARGAREAGVSTRETIANRLNEINKIIRDSNLRPENKAELAITSKRIAEVKNEATFEQIKNDKIAQIERLESAQRFRDAKTKINKTIKSTKIKNRVSKFPAEQQNTMQKLFNILREDTKLNQEEAIKKLNNNLKELDGEIPSFEQRIENTLLGIKAGSDLVDIRDAENLATDLENLIEKGKELKDLRTFEAWQELQNDKEDVLGALDYKQGRETFGKKTEKVLDRIKSKFKILGVKVLTDWNGLMEDIDWSRPLDNKVLRNKFNVTPNNSDYAGRYGTYNRELHKVIRETYPDRFNEKFKKLPDKVRKSLEFSPWTDGFVSRLIITDLINEKVSLGKLKNKDGVVRELKMSRGELIKRYIELQDPTLIESFIHGNKYTEEIIEAIDKAMNKEDKVFAKESMRMWQELYDQINPVYKEVYGINLAKNPFYSPIRREGFEVDIENQFGEFLGEQFHRSAVTSGSFNERVNSILPIQTQDVFESLDKHFGEMTYFVAWAKQVRRFHDIFNDKSIRDGIKDTFGDSAGKKLLERIDFQIRQFANKGHRNAASFEKMVGKARRMFIMGKIFFKPVIMFKQLVSRVNYLEILNVKELTIGEDEFWKNPKQKSELLRNESPFMKERGQHYERDINDTLKSEEYARYTKTKAFLELGSLWVKIGDADATIFPATWAYRKKLMEERGLNPNNSAPQEVIDIYEDFADNTQQSANASTQSEWQQSGEFAKIFTVFRTQQHQNARKVVQAVKSVFQKGGTKKSNLKRVAKVILIYHSIQNMLFQLVATGLIQLLGDDEDKEEFVKDMARAGILGSLNFFPLGYDLIDSIVRSVMGSQVFNQGSASTPIDSIAKDIYNLAKEIDPTEIEDFEVMEFINDLARLGGDFSIPSEQALNFGRGIYSMTQGNFLRGTLEMSQWSQWALEPLEKEKSIGIPEIEIPEIKIPEIKIPEISF